MGKLTFSLTDNFGNTVTEERSVSDVDGTRIIAAYATTARSTVAGGGSNKVMVMSDGTNWLIVA